MLTDDLWHINTHWKNLKLILLIDGVSFYNTCTSHWCISCFTLTSLEHRSTRLSIVAKKDCSRRNLVDSIELILLTQRPTWTNCFLNETYLGEELVLSARDQATSYELKHYRV